MTVTIITDTTKSKCVSSYNADYATGRAGASGTVYAPAVGQFLTGANYRTIRDMMIFDTSVIPVGAIITAAKLKLYAISVLLDAAYDIVVQNGQPTYPSDPVVGTDFDMTFYSGNGGSIDSATLVISSYNDLSLNATGISWINCGGSTKLCLRSSRDLSGTAPPYSPFLEYADLGNPATVGQEPKLEVTWTNTPPSSGVSNSAKLIGHGLL